MTLPTLRSSSRLFARLAVWLIVAGLVVVPLALVVSLAFGGNQFPVLAANGVGRATVNSLVTALVSAVAALVVGTTAAVVLDRTTVRGAGLLRVLVLSPLLVPPFVGAIAWLQLFSPGQGVNRLFAGVTGGDLWNIHGVDGVIVLLTVHSYPMVTIIVSTALRQLPGDLESAARISGAGTATAIRTVTLPLLRPALLSAFTLTFIANLADFGIPRLLNYETLATVIYRFMDSGTVDSPLQVASTVGVVLIGLGVAAVIADHLVAGRAGTAGRLQDTGTAGRYTLGRWTWPTTLVSWAVALAVTVAPVCGLVYRALLPAPGVPFTPENISLDNFARALSNPRTLDGVTNSVTLSVAAAVLCGLLGWAVGLLVTRTRARGDVLLTLTVLLPTALPGLLIGIAWLLVGRYTGTYNTLWVILGAYVCAFTALVLQSVRGPLSQLPDSVEEAARVSGAGPLRALVSTSGAMIRPAALAGAVLVLVTAVRELTVSVLLVAPGTTTLGVQVFNLQQAGNYNQASALSLLFMVVGVVALVLTLRPARVEKTNREKASARVTH